MFDSNSLIKLQSAEKKTTRKQKYLELPPINNPNK